MKQYYTYILTNYTNSVLYIGVTNDLERRVYEHKHKLAEGFTKQYNLYKPVYFEIYNSIEEAIKREKQLKGWRREKKVKLIEKGNPEWRDLSVTW